MLDTTDAVEALQAFARYATRIEDETRGANIPQMVICDDGSGRIVDLASGTVYLGGFSSFTSLLEWLKKQ